MEFQHFPFNSAEGSSFFSLKKVAKLPLKHAARGRVGDDGVEEPIRQHFWHAVAANLQTTKIEPEPSSPRTAGPAEQPAVHQLSGFRSRLYQRKIPGILILHRHLEEISSVPNSETIPFFVANQAMKSKI